MSLWDQKKSTLKVKGNIANSMQDILDQFLTYPASTQHYIWMIITGLCIWKMVDGSN